ncbi:glycerophosphodiester phosphodiesterase [Nocardioides pantholopis]|uniref:glycerophosphodiester phosphodiesterase n=1 Tax=Nocardioides pantholopis TaxID=2483798 RepID=UPI0013DDBFFC|nr:glycerophosphodiester phosphodiesterase [Nocardioides pantholopis]
MRGHRPPAVQLSAHRCGAGGDRALENTRTALDRALTLGVEYVEFDVHRCADGTLVLFHDDWVPVDGERRWLREVTFEQFQARAVHFLRYEEVLEALRGRARAHIDLKFASPRGEHEVAAVARAVEVLGAENIIVTTQHDRSVRAVREWSDARGLPLLTGLSLGRRVRGLPIRAAARIRLSELLPRRRYRASLANLMVANHTLARFGIARFARRRGLPLVVWTIDTPGSMRYWMKPGRAWLVTTNHPEMGLAVRAERTGRMQP